MNTTESKLWVVETSTQEVNLVCRIFACEQDAQAYAATAREWTVRHWERNYEAMAAQTRCTPWPKDHCRTMLERDTGHRADLVDEAKAASEAWPFGDDPHSDSFTVTAYPFQPAPKPNPQSILDALLAYGDHLPHCEKWPECQCGYVLAISTARGDFR